MTQKISLTPVEHKFMEILWKLDGGTVRDVIANLPEDETKPAYTSVSTILRILEQKGILTVEKFGRQHIYKPSVTKESYATHSVNKIVDQIFDGSATGLVAYLMKKDDLSTDDIGEIQKILDQKKQEFA